MSTARSHRCSRRTLLRGLGVSMALPWLESLPRAVAAAATAAAQPPTRTLVTFTGMGFHSQHWWAKGEGSAMELGPCLEPLAPDELSHPNYEAGVCCHRCADDLDDETRARRRERLRQIAAAKARGEEHLQTGPSPDEL